MGMKISDHRNGTQPKVRNWTAVDAHMRSSAGAMGKRGKGRTFRDNRSRQTVKSAIRGGDFA